MEVLSHNTPMIKQTIQHFHGGIISYTPMIKQTISMEVLSHSTPMIKQTIQTFPWRYYLIVPP